MRSVIAVLLGLLLVASLAVAQDDPFGDDDDRQKAERMERDDDDRDEDEGEEEEDWDEDEGEELEMLDRNVRLDFHMEPLEGNDKGTYIVTATPWYESEMRFSGDNHEMEFGIDGKIELLDDGRIFVSYDVHLEWEGGEGNASFHAGSAILLKSGKAVRVARFGDRQLVIKATFLDDVDDD